MASCLQKSKLMYMYVYAAKLQTMAKERVSAANVILKVREEWPIYLLATRFRYQIEVFEDPPMQHPSF